MSFPVLRSAHIHPVKSLAARACDQVVVEPWGLDGDRRWMLVDKAARAVTQRQQPSMARISAEPLPGGGVLLSAPGFAPLRVEGPEPGRMVSAELHRDTVVVEEAAAGPMAEAVSEALAAAGHTAPGIFGAVPSAGARRLR